MFIINTVALVILGILLLRKAVLMERFFEVRVYLITAFLCGLLLFFVVSLIAYNDPPCLPPPPTPGGHEFFLCSEF
ncbi:MAG TPA: hypothetical protein VGP08_02195 [Pyrinomonadaceae bacterium]|nr:hypothetical protein [Pyrinomonadaceae bacterium]